MSEVAPRTYQFRVPADTVKVRLFYTAGDQPPTKESPFIELDVPPGTPDADNKLTMNVPLPGQTQIAEGTYTLGVMTIDKSGNKGNISAVVTYPFDFTPPGDASDGVIL